MTVIGIFDQTLTPRLGQYGEIYNVVKTAIENHRKGSFWYGLFNYLNSGFVVKTAKGKGEYSGQAYVSEKTGKVVRIMLEVG